METKKKVKELKINNIEKLPKVIKPKNIYYVRKSKKRMNEIYHPLMVEYNVILEY